MHNAKNFLIAIVIWIAASPFSENALVLPFSKTISEMILTSTFVLLSSSDHVLTLVTYPDVLFEDICIPAGKVHQMLLLLCLSCLAFALLLGVFL